MVVCLFFVFCFRTKEIAHLPYFLSTWSVSCTCFWPRRDQLSNSNHAVGSEEKGQTTFSWHKEITRLFILTAFRQHLRNTRCLTSYGTQWLTTFFHVKVEIFVKARLIIKSYVLLKWMSGWIFYPRRTFVFPFAQTDEKKKQTKNQKQTVFHHDSALCPRQTKLQNGSKQETNFKGEKK